MQTVTYIYILMLAVADEIFLLGLPFLIVTASQKSWIFGLPMCKIYMTTTSINQVNSMLLLYIVTLCPNQAIGQLNDPTILSPEY